MNPRLVALATVLDVVVLVGLGVGIFFAPLTLVWAFDDGFSTELLSSWAVAVQGWFLGHAVPLEVTLPLDLAQSLGLGVVGRKLPRRRGVTGDCPVDGVVGLPHWRAGEYPASPSDDLVFSRRHHGGSEFSFGLFLTGGKCQHLER